MPESSIKPSELGKFPDSTRSQFVRLKILLLVLVPLWFLNSQVPASAETKPKHVLVLSSQRPTSPVTYRWSLGIRSVFESASPHGIKIDIEYLDIARFNDDQYLKMLLDVYQYKYSKLKPDLIISVYNSALDFTMKYGTDLFAGVPIVFFDVERSFIENRSLGPSTTGLLASNTYTETLDLALSLHPGTRRVTVLGGSGPVGQGYFKSAREAFRGYEDRIDFTYLTRLPIEDILEKVAILPGQTLVIYLPLLADGAGKKFHAPVSLSLISRASRAPVYSCWDVLLGHGIVGGYLNSFEKMGEAAAELALRILNEENPVAIPQIQKPKFHYMFDWRQLKRWSISEDQLPPGSIVKFKELTVWDMYKGRIIGAFALVLFQVLIISYLLYQRRIRRKVEQSYRTVADYTYDWEYWENDDGSLEYVSPSCERISGYTIQEFKTAPSLFKDIILPEDREIWDIHDHKSAENEEPSGIQFRIKRKDGQIRWIENVCQPVKTNQGDHLGIRGSNRDITERKLAEINAQKHREELTYISRVTTLGELSASMAHELNQPLAAILNNANAAMKFISGDRKDLDEVNEILNDIIKDDRRASGIIKKLRTLMSKKEMEFSPLNLNEIIWGVAKLTDRETSVRDVPLILELDDDLPHVKGDAIHLEQIILNLILNGTEAMVTIDRQFRKLRICTTEHDRDFIKVSVEDKGTGIDEAHINSIFETFYTTKPGGMGMGLSICRSIIEAHGGRLWAENNPDQGATVYFTVPVFMGDEA